MQFDGGKNKRKMPIWWRLIVIILSAVLVGLVVAIGYVMICWVFDDDFSPSSSNNTNTIVVKETVVDFSIPSPSEEEVNEWTVESYLPRYMSVPSLNITNARVESLGLKGDTNQIDDPYNVWNAAWYNESAQPGADGVGIYSCHTFFAPGGLCDGFGELPLGTEITIERGDGAVFTYQIVENITMTKAEADDYMATLFELPNIDNARQGISLITCAGEYDVNSGIASHRTMVRTILK